MHPQRTTSNFRLSGRSQPYTVDRSKHEQYSKRGKENLESYGEDTYARNSDQYLRQPFNDCRPLAHSNETNFPNYERGYYSIAPYTDSENVQNQENYGFHQDQLFSNNSHQDYDYVDTQSRFEFDGRQMQHNFQPQITTQQNPFQVEKRNFQVKLPLQGSGSFPSENRNFQPKIAQKMIQNLSLRSEGDERNAGAQARPMQSSFTPLAPQGERSTEVRAFNAGAPENNKVRLITSTFPNEVAATNTKDKNYERSTANQSETFQIKRREGLMRLLTGSVDKILVWAKLKDTLHVMFEVIGTLDNQRQGNMSCEKILILRDAKTGPALQVVFYEIDKKLPELKTRSVVKCIGTMLTRNKLHAFKVCQSSVEEKTALQHVTFICNRVAQEASATSQNRK